MFAYRLAFGLKTLTFKNSIWPACPWALISSLISLPAAVECWRYSTVNCWSCGSTHTSLQTSFNSINIIFLMWLYCKGNKVPPSCKKDHAGPQTYCHIHNWMVVLWVSNHIWYRYFIYILTILYILILFCFWYF